MIIGAIFFAFVAACAVVLLVAILKSAYEDTQATELAQQPTGHVILPGERTGRFTREPVHTGRFDREGQPVR